MSSTSGPSVLDLVRLDADAARAVLALPRADRWQWRTWDSIDELAAHLKNAGGNARVLLFVAATRADRVDAAALRALRQGPRRVVVVVVLREFGGGSAFDLLRHGADVVERLPLPPYSPDLFLQERRAFAAIFPGELVGLERQVVEFVLPVRREVVPPLVRTLCEACERLGHPDEFVRSQLPLVVDEAVTNAMQHGSAWDAACVVRVRAVLEPSRIELHVEDEGPGFDRAEVADPLQGENLRREGGRGLFLMESLMDRVQYRDGGRTIVLSKEFVVRVAEDESVVVHPI